MPLDIDVATCSLEVHDHQLPVVVEHEVLWGDVAVEVPALVDELERFEDVEDDRLGGQVGDRRLILLKHHKVLLLQPVVVHPIDARPLGLRDVLPQLVVHLDDQVGLLDLGDVLDGHGLVVALGVAVEQ